MKTTNKVLNFLVIILFGLLLTACGTNLSTTDGGRIVVGQNFTLGSGETIDGDLVVTGANATLEDGSTVNGNIAVMGGNVTVDGKVKGDIFATGGNIALGDTAVVQGDVNAVGGSIRKSDKAVIEGNLGNATSPRLTTPGVIVKPDTVLPFNPFKAGFDLARQVLWPIFQAIAIGLMAMLVALFAARPMQRSGDAIVNAPMMSSGIDPYAVRG